MRREDCFFAAPGLGFSIVASLAWARASYAHHLSYHGHRTTGETAMKLSSRATAAVSAVIGFSLLLAGLTACSASSQGNGAVTLNVATVNNSQMVQMEKLTAQVFEKDHPNIKVNFVTLDESDLRSKVTQDVATNAGKFDIATIGSYETPIWAHNGWIQDLSPYLAKMSASEKR